jgi:DNA-dependent RNA polymerase auxiliary subunit epsilon
MGSIDKEDDISKAMAPQNLLGEITARKRAEREAEIREATRTLHIEAGRDPDRALDRCSAEEAAHNVLLVREISMRHLKLYAQQKAEREAYAKYEAEMAKYKAAKANAQQ